MSTMCASESYHNFILFRQVANIPFDFVTYILERGHV